MVGLLDCWIVDLFGRSRRNRSTKKPINQFLFPHPLLRQPEQAIEGEEKEKRAGQTEKDYDTRTEAVEVGDQPAAQHKENSKEKYKQLEFGSFPMAAHCVSTFCTNRILAEIQFVICGAIIALW